MINAVKRIFPLLIFLSWSIGLLTWSFVPATAQQNAIDSLKIKFNDYRRQHFQEKVYLHLDRPSYLTGETIWFKVYLTDASIHKPTTLSKVVYVEIINRSGQSLVQAKIEMKNGSGAGSLYLPATLGSDNYVIRAYTNWMKNFNPEFYFHKPVCILNTFKSGEIIAPSLETLIDAQFFPEGGNLLAGVKNKVAFRVINESGSGIDFKGALIDQFNDTLLHFAPQHFGIGNFTFIPQLQPYRVVIKNKLGKMKLFNLPVVLRSGYSMRVSTLSDKQMEVEINAVVDDPSEFPGTYLFIHCRNRIVYAAFRALRQGSAAFVISRADIPEGISHLTAFNASMKPVCERLYFKQPERDLTVAVQSDRAYYEPRHPVKMEMSAMLGQNKVEADLSIAVFKMDSLPSSSGNINSYFWLTSDLRGTVESPEYYFSTQPDVEQAADNLMLTHGWRRFQWDEVLKESKSILNHLPEYRGHIVHGRVQKNDGSNAYGVMTYLSTPGKIIKVFPSRSNGFGEVQFEMKNFYGPSKIIAQVNHKRDSTLRIAIHSPFSEQLASYPFPALKLDAFLETTLMKRSIAMQVQDIYFGNDAKIIPLLTDSAGFYGKADETYLLDDFTRFPVMEEVMREYVPGVFVRKRRDGFHFLVRDDVNKSAFEESPLILLDGVPIFDEDEIMSFSPLQIKKLEVMTRRWYLGFLNFPGVVSYTTYKGDLGGFQLNPNSVTLDYEGLQLKREFYSPKYDSQVKLESRLPDQRYTLFWAPSIRSTTDGSFPVEFYTSDVPGKYKIVVEGMTKDGNLGSATSTFTVRER